MKLQKAATIIDMKNTLNNVMSDSESQYEFECLISEQYKDYTSCDEWGVATLWLNDEQGVEYNFCIDGEYNSCAIYKMCYEFCKDYDEITTDYSVFEHYEVDFNNPDWEKALEKAMYKAAKKIFKE